MTSSTVVLVPGLTCDETFWRTPAAALRPAHPVVVPRLHDERSIDDMAQVSLRAATGPLHVVGHSMGGRVALAMYRMAPERFRSLALLDTGAHPPGDDEAAMRQPRRDLAASEGMAALARDWVPQMIHRSRRDDSELIDAITSMVTSYTPRQYDGQIEALLGRRDERPTLATITCPTLVACGDDDTWSPPAQHAAIADAIPQARLEILADAGHMVAMERPDETAAMLCDWLASVDTRDTRDDAD